MDKMIILEQFPTHVAKTNNKHKVNKMFKINNQAIYNGSINRFSRAIVMNNMHTWLKDKFDEVNLTRYTPKTYPVQLILRIHTVINHGNVRWSIKENRSTCSIPKEDYKPTWDEDNLSSIWIKAIKDSLTEYGFWKDDDVSLCRGTDSLVEFVDSFEDRKIEIGFKVL